MLKKLTDTAIRAAKPKEKPYKITDGGGLYVLVNPGGSKLWRLKYYFWGKERLFAIGIYPAISLREASDRAAKAKEMVARGMDPCAAARQPRRKPSPGAHLKSGGITLYNLCH